MMSILEKQMEKKSKTVKVEAKPNSLPKNSEKSIAKPVVPTTHNLDKMEHEVKLYEKVQKRLSDDYSFSPVETISADIGITKQNVTAELEGPINGTPLKYNTAQLAATEITPNYLPRSQSWNHNSRGQGQQQYWGRANSSRSDFPPESPSLGHYGSSQNNSHNSYYGGNSMTPPHHSYHSGTRPNFKEFVPRSQQQKSSRPAPLTIPDRFQRPQEINPNTPNSKQPPLTVPNRNARSNNNYQNNKQQNRFPTRPQTCQREYRGNWGNFNRNGGHHYQNQNRLQSARSNFNSSTPRGEIPTSCRLSQMAENDRHSLLPSSTRSSYKSVTYTDSSKIRDVFLEICARLEAEFGKENLIYPREIIWMIGPPGAGKSTLARFLSEQRNYNSTPIVLREICQMVIANNDGKLKIEQVVEELMIKLFDPQFCDGVVVDGFVSITSARVVPFMFKYFHEIFQLSKNPNPPVFKFCVLYVNEDNSVRRQIVNYEQGGKKSNRSFDAEAGRKLYRKFLKRTQQVVELIEMHFSFRLIDANGTLPQVQLIASAEMASETNGSLIHDATLTKALSPAANPSRRRNQSWKNYNQRPQRNNSSFRSNSYRSNNSSFRSNTSTNLQSPSNHNRTTSEFRLAPKNHPSQFAHNLNVDIMQHVVQIDERELLASLRQTVLEITYGQNYSRQMQNKIPSAKLINLDTTNYENIVEDYVVRPLIKGTHAMLYWDPAGHCYLIDRRFQFFTLRSNFYQAAHVGEGLLDGVLVVDTEGRIVFIAHDAATHQSKRLKDCWFSQRTHECRTAVKDLNCSSDGSEPIQIVFLESVKTKNIDKLLSKIYLKDSGEGRLLDLGNNGKVSVHGFSFVPDKAGFHATNGPKTYTWTFLEGAARDFKVKAPYDEEQVFLYLQGPKNADSCFQRGKFEEESQKKFNEIVGQAKEAGMTKSFIVSCQYSKSARLWVPIRFQPNKNRAASINVVAESISSWENRMPLDELLAFSSGEDINLTDGAHTCI